jgi:predicted enzyme related to lactoylglutathione lyase
MISGIHQVVLEVEDQDRALDYWTKTMNFELIRDEPYGDERWLEVRTRDEAVTMVLSLREGERPTAPDMLPTSNLFFYCDNLRETYKELRSRGVDFPQPPMEQPFGWWSLFEDFEGNRFALAPREWHQPRKEARP